MLLGSGQSLAGEDTSHRRPMVDCWSCKAPPLSTVLNDSINITANTLRVSVF